MDTKRRFRKIKLGLMRSPMFMDLSGVMMLGNTTLEVGFPTACTNGRDEMYGIEFIESFEDDKQVGFVIVHENMHKACRHMELYKGIRAIDAQLSNCAMDYWINGGLKKLDPKETIIKMPMKDGEVYGLYDPKFEGMSVLDIFRDLQANGMPESAKGNGEAGDGQGTGQGEGSGNFDEHDWDGAEAMTKEDKQKLEQDVKQAIRQGLMVAKKAGVGGCSNAMGLGEIVSPKIPWDRILDQFVRQSCTSRDVSSWRRPNRRFLHQDIIMPTLEGQSIREIVVGIDASGSMYGSPLQKVVGAIKVLSESLNIDKVHVLYWDGDVATPHEEYDAQSFKQFVTTTKVIGGGGTSPACVPEYMKEHNINPECVIMLTDGYVDGWGTWNVPVIWAMTTDETAPTGVTIKIED